jgi:enoyl-CoA hydratase / 3-hydroxyacyl-CoA dehydrogenase
MEKQTELYPSFFNPLFKTLERSFPGEVAIIGAGTIGPDIGYYIKSALPGIKLFLVDVDEKALSNAQKRYENYARKGVARKKTTEEEARDILQNIEYTTEYPRIKNCSLVVESATEHIPLKQKIFEDVEKIVNEDTIITSNSSSIPPGRLFLKMKRPERCTVTHFFAPAWRSLAVEVVNWETISKDVLEYLFWFFTATGKAPVITDNVICFMLDRIFDNWCNEAAYLLNDATASQVCAAVEEFAFQGPFYVLNMGNGNPIIIETNTLQMEEGEHYRPAPIFASVEQWRVPRPGTPVEMSNAVLNSVRDRMLGILFSQSFDIVDRGIGTMGDLNFGCQIALGFKKGPLDIMRDIGETEVDRIMTRFEKERPGFPRPNKPLTDYQDFKRYLLVDDWDGVKVITIRRPQAMNAISDELNNEILDVLKQYHDDPSVKGFVLTGYGNRAFSAGGDIGKFPETLGNKDAAIKYAKDSAEVQLFMDRMEKPIVAAVNGMALGGGFELAIRCHSIVAMENARFQFPEITLGILPGIGGCIVPYRKWPQGASLFHEMICLARPLGIKEAQEVELVSKVVDRYDRMIEEAVSEVERLQGNIPRIAEGPVQIPDIKIPENPAAGSLKLSREGISIIARTIEKGAAADSFESALEIGYQGAGDIACTDAAKEGISAFLEKRKPSFEK